MLLARIDRPTPRRLAKSWPKGTTRVARMMFADAHRDGLIAANPFTQLRLETPKARKDLDALTEEQIGTLAAAAIPAMGEYGPQFRAVVLFLADVGCRPGELCCIRRADVDRERRGHDPLHARWPRGREASEERPPSRRDHPATGTPGARRRAAAPGQPVPVSHHDRPSAVQGHPVLCVRVVRQRWPSASAWSYTSCATPAPRC
jgi:integrase